VQFFALVFTFVKTNDGGWNSFLANPADVHIVKTSLESLFQLASVSVSDKSGLMSKAELQNLCQVHLPSVSGIVGGIVDQYLPQVRISDCSVILDASRFILLTI
jgi:hypothetical protein